MASKLTDYYARAAKEFGVMGRMKLAMLTKVPSEKAAAEPDSPDNLKLFEQAFAQIKLASAA
jgi:hypothetical protein